MDSNKLKNRLAAALRVKAEAEALGDASIGQDWKRRITQWVEKDEFPPRSEVEEHRKRTVGLAKPAKLDVTRLLNAIDKLLPTLA